jgi:hypothetical protein
MTPRVIGLACDVRFTSEIRAGIVENALRFEQSINVGLRSECFRVESCWRRELQNLEPQFEKYCPEQSVSPQTETITSNFQMIADAFEQPCDA